MKNEEVEALEPLGEALGIDLASHETLLNFSGGQGSNLLLIDH